MQHTIIPIRFLTLLMLMVFSNACRKEQISVDPTVICQEPSIPMYRQMLLCGDVFSVKDSIVSGLNYPTHIEYAEFYEKNLVKYMYDGENTGTDSGTRCVFFERIREFYAFLKYPFTWTSMDSVIEKSGDLSIEVKWDNSGKYVKMRCYNGTTPLSPEGFEGEYELEKLLYDANGFPKYSFSLSHEGVLSVSCEQSFEDIDEFGNAHKILVKTANGDYTIYRSIKYNTENSVRL